MLQVRTAIVNGTFNADHRDPAPPLISHGTVQRMGDQAALASGSFLLACG
jgi:hypothetical protein